MMGVHPALVTDDALRAFELLGEEVVEHRPNRGDGRKLADLGERRRHRGAEDVGSELELQSQREEASQDQPDALIGARTDPQLG